jgi:hypothetical protein
MRRSHPPHPNRTRSLACLSALWLLLALPAQADFAPDGIEIDGNYVDDAAPEADWFPDFPPMSDPLGDEDTTLCGTSPAPKNDIINSFLANNYDYLYVGMERRTNNGNTSFFFKFDITGDGDSVGDFIFVFCFGSGATVTDTYVLEWDPALLEWVRDATPPEVVFAVNLTDETAPFGTYDERGRPTNRIDPGRFAEARITLADIEGFDVCEADGVLGEIQTKSSCSLSSECKDTTGPFTFSFEPLTVDLEVAQVPGCTPAITATANADTRAGAEDVSYQWFLDGEDITDRDPLYAVSDTILIELDDECGPTTVSVIVDDGTCIAEDSADVDVNARPEAVITELSAGACDKTISYDASGSTDCNGTELLYAWDFNGDGAPDSLEATGTYTYDSCGPKIVTLIVSDGECVSDPDVTAIHVNEPPVASLQVSPTGCLAVDWTAPSTDCDLGSPSPLYSESLSTELDLGDGSPPVSGAESGDHAYADCGAYVLTLTVTDASGCTAEDQRTVTFTGVLTVD